MNSKRVLIARRDKAFVGACMKIILEYERLGRPAPVGHVIGRALALAPPCYCIGPRRALTVFGRDGSRLEAIAALPEKGEWRDLARKVISSMNGPRRMNFRKALMFNVIYGRPDVFYISMSHARDLLRPYVNRVNAVTGRIVTNVK